VEIVEHDDHPFFLGTQFHPEFRSRPDRASPPFVGFVDAVIEQTGVHDTAEGEPANDPDGVDDETEVTA
jgi:CTP synthase